MKKQTHPTHVVRKSRGLKHKMEECSSIMKSVDKFVQGTAAKIARYERQISLLMIENNVLRKALKMQGCKKPPVKLSFPFMFPELANSPNDILNRRIEEILPLTDNMDTVMRGARTRVISLFKNCEWQTPGDLLQKNRNVEGPEWKELLKYRNFGKLSLSILSASFNHFKVDRKNLPVQVVESVA